MKSFEAGTWVTPDPLPNSAVKPGNADDTSGTGLWPVMHRLKTWATNNFLSVNVDIMVKS